MPDIFLVIAALLALLAGLPFCAPDRRLLNFVDYGTGDAVRRLNRHAALRMLLPVAVNLGCALLARMHPQWSVPLLFLTPLSVLGVVLRVGVIAGRMSVPAASTIASKDEQA